MQKLYLTCLPKVSQQEMEVRPTVKYVSTMIDWTYLDLKTHKIFSPMAVLEYKPIIYLIGHNIPNTTNDLQPQTALLLLIFIFGVAASFLGFVYSSFPDMSETESSYVKFPKVGVSIHHNILDL